MFLAVKYEILLFDADNTLFDFSRAERAAIRETMRAFGIMPNEALVCSYSEVNDRMWKMLERGEIDYFETNLNLETNTQVMAQWKYFDAQQHKRRRSYIKQINT